MNACACVGGDVRLVQRGGMNHRVDADRVVARTRERGHSLFSRARRFDGNGLC